MRLKRAAAVQSVRAAATRRSQPCSPHLEGKVEYEGHRVLWGWGLRWHRLRWCTHAAVVLRRQRMATGVCLLEDVIESEVAGLLDRLLWCSALTRSQKQMDLQYLT